MKRGLNIDRMYTPMLSAEYQFQIFVKLLSGKTFTMDVRSSNNIREVEVLIRNRLEPDQKEFFSWSCYLTFQGKVLKYSFQLSDYNIQKNDTIHQTARLLGGAKRGRTSEDIIPKFLGVPQVNQNDKPEVRAMFELTSINIESWLGSMPQDKIGELLQVMEKYEKYGFLTPPSRPSASSSRRWNG